MFAWRSAGPAARLGACAAGARGLPRGPKTLNGEAWSLRELGVIAQLRGDLDEADSLYEQAAAMFRELGDVRGLQVVIHDQAICARCNAATTLGARALLEESLARARELGSELNVGERLLDLGSWRSTSAATTTRSRSSSRASRVALRHGCALNVAVSLRGLAAVGGGQRRARAGGPHARRGRDARGADRMSEMHCRTNGRPSKRP